MAYVPPALRTKQEKVAEPSKHDHKSDDQSSSLSASIASTAARPTLQRLPSNVEIHKHYWLHGTKMDDEQQHIPINDSMHYSTLNSSADDPDRLKYVMLFHDANPHWHSKGIIFVKSSLHLLPGSEKFIPQTGKENKPKEPVEKQGDKRTAGENSGAGQGEKDVDGSTTPATDKQVIPSAKETTESTIKIESEVTVEGTYNPDLSLYDLGPIAVFEQHGGRKGGFRFAGYHKIARLQFLEPHSSELLRMLKQKFSKEDRFGNVRQQERPRSAWEASMRHRWAVIKLDKDEEANSTLGDPEIEVREGEIESREPKKSVNELLKELRVKD